MDWIKQRGVWFIALGILLFILAAVRCNKNVGHKSDFWSNLLIIFGFVSIIYAILWFSGLGKFTAVKHAISDLKQEAGDIVDRVRSAE